VEVKDVGINWLAAAAYLVERIPFEKMLSRPKDKSEYMAELKEILKESQKSTPAPNKVEVKASANSTSNVTTKETVDYQNREMGKVLIQMERHAAQGLRIAGKPCDCLSKHMVDLEALAEETITMVSNPEIYLQIIDWVRSIAPKTTVEANESGLYAQEYPVIARQARDFRKELLGTLDYKVLFNWDKTLEDIHKEKTAGKKSPRRKKITEMKIPPELAQENPFAPDTIIPDAAETPDNMPESALSEPVPDQADEIVNQNVNLSPNGTACTDLKSMTEWAAGEDETKCRECMLTITVPWYYEELEAQGEKELAEDMQKVQQEGDPVKVAAALDQIKEQVKPEVKQRLLEFDCASQSFEI